MLVELLWCVWRDALDADEAKAVERREEVEDMDEDDEEDDDEDDEEEGDEEEGTEEGESKAAANEFNRSTPGSPASRRRTNRSKTS